MLNYFKGLIALLFVLVCYIIKPFAYLIGFLLGLIWGIFKIPGRIYDGIRS